MKDEKVTAGAILALLERQGYRCALTGEQLSPETASIDHITPLGKGGDHAITNAQIVHAKVNSAKGTMTNAEFIEMCRAVVAHAEGLRLGKAEGCAGRA